MKWPDEARIVSWTWTLTALVFQLAVINAVLAFTWWSGGHYLLHRRFVGYHPGWSLALGGLVGLGLAAVAQLPPLAPMWAAVVGRQGPPSWGGRFVVVVCGAVAEELLFRGLLGPMIGTIAATALFAASHVPSERALRAWPLVGLASGAVFVWVYREGGGVLGPIVAHACFELSGRFSVATSTGSAR